MSELEDEIKRIAPHLDALKKSDQATCVYQGVCGALVWSDELPAEPLSDELAIRYLLRYRTSMILGEPIEAIVSYWEVAKDSFPNWPGFSPERCQESVELASRIREMQAELQTFLNEEDDVTDAST